jgi:glutamyl-tRNA reductase
VYLIDLGVPRNSDEGLKSLDGRYPVRYRRPGRLVAGSREDRGREAERAESSVEVELDSFMKWLDALAIVPVIKDIRSSIDQVLYGELQRHRAWLARKGRAAAARIESLTRGIANKLQHRVIFGLRHYCGGGSHLTYAAEIARNLRDELYEERGFNHEADNYSDASEPSCH